MELEDLKYLTDEQRERYMTMERLFEQPGWTLVEKWAGINRDEAKERAANAQSWEDNRIAVGLRIAYDTFSKMRDINEREYMQLAQDQREEQEEDNELEHE